MLLLTILALFASAVASLWAGHIPLALFCAAWALVLPLIEWNLGLPPPDFVIGADYLRRWHIIPPNRFFSVYLHEIRHDDDDRALHDHPACSVSLILKGSYREITRKGAKVHGPFDIIARRGSTAHRLEVVDGPVWTLFFFGPRYRQWGFHCPKGWRHWTQFVDQRDHGKVGRGCA